MGSTIIYEQVKGTAKYSVSFGGNPSSISNQEIKEPLTAYNIARELQQRGVIPEVSRSISFHSGEGCCIEDTRFERLTFERLEELMVNEDLPSIRHWIKKKSYSK